MDREELAGSSRSSNGSDPARGVGPDDQGMPDGMSSVSKTVHSDDEHLMIRNNMIHQFEREVLISKLAEVQMASKEELTYLEDQCQALTDEIQQSAIDKSMLRERVAELEKALADRHGTSPSPPTPVPVARKQGWTTLLTHTPDSKLNKQHCNNNSESHRSSSKNGSQDELNEKDWSSVRAWTALASSLLVLYDSPEQGRVLRWTDMSRTPVRAFGGDADDHPFRFEIGSDDMEADNEDCQINCRWIIQCAGDIDYSSWHKELSTVPTTDTCVQLRHHLNALHTAPQVNTKPALVSSVAQLAGGVQELGALREVYTNLNEEAEGMQAKLDAVYGMNSDSDATIGDAGLKAAVTENERLREALASGTIERTRLKERVGRAVKNLKASVAVERSNWMLEKRELLRQVQRATEASGRWGSPPETHDEEGNTDLFHYSVGAAAAATAGSTNVLKTPKRGSPPQTKKCTLASIASLSAHELKQSTNAELNESDCDDDEEDDESIDENIDADDDRGIAPVTAAVVDDSN